MAAAQQTCGDTQEIISKSSLKIKFFPTTGRDLACDVSQVTAVVPVSFRQQICILIYPQHRPPRHQGQQAADFGEVRVEEDGISDC